MAACLVFWRGWRSASPGLFLAVSLSVPDARGLAVADVRDTGFEGGQEAAVRKMLSVGLAEGVFLTCA